MTFGDYLSTLRVNRGYSQRQLAIKSGVSHAEISRLESNERVASLQTIKKLSKSLGVSNEDLFRAAGHLKPVDEIDLLNIIEDNPDTLRAAGKPVTPEQRTEILKILDQDAKPQPEPPPQRKKVDLSDMVIAAEAKGYVEMTPISDELREILERIIGDVIDERERERKLEKENSKD